MTGQLKQLMLAIAGIEVDDGRALDILRALVLSGGTVYLASNADLEYAIRIAVNGDTIQAGLVARHTADGQPMTLDEWQIQAGDRVAAVENDLNTVAFEEMQGHG